MLTAQEIIQKIREQPRGRLENEGVVLTIAEFDTLVEWAEIGLDIVDTLGCECIHGWEHHKFCHESKACKMCKDK